MYLPYLKINKGLRSEKIKKTLCMDAVPNTECFFIFELRLREKAPLP